VFSGVILEKPGDLDRKMFKDDQELDPVEQTERGVGVLEAWPLETAKRSARPPSLAWKQRKS
jgi:hypothetical protein